jgi:hypothetical protein
VVFGDVDRLPNHLGADERLDRDRSRLIAAGAESDAGEPAEPDDGGGSGNT